MIKDILGYWGMIGGASIVSSSLTYIFSKKRQNKEIENQELTNVQQALEIYRGIIDDLKQEQKELKEEMRQMRLDFEQKLAEAEAKHKI